MSATQHAFATTAEFDSDVQDASARTSDDVLPVDELQLEAEGLLEFDRVRADVAGLARMIMAQELVMSMHPARHPDDVGRLQAETAEARALLESKGDVGLTGLVDIRPALRRAMLGGVLDGVEIREVCAVYDSAWVAKSTVESMGDGIPLLAVRAALIHDLRGVTDQVEHALSPSGDVLDRATPRLGKLRQQVSIAYKRLVDQLERFTQQQATREALRSDVIASRNGRMVLEVKSSFKSSIPGVIHGVSGSGQTVFIEPTAAVNAGNSWHEALDAAQREEARVLRTLTATIGRSGEEALVSIQAAASIDVAMARARYARATKSVAITPFDATAGKRISLVDALHPLLGEEAVPITLRIDAECRGLVITGPNTGGKTVAMKTLGLFAMMYQSGMQLPCNEATVMPVFSGVYADIGDAQSIDRSVSTFSSHMQRVVNISRRVAQLAAIGGDGSSALVLLDELGTGTDMDEGSALARAVLDDLVSRDAWVCVTTHHRTVADFAAGHPSLQNASVEVDSVTMLPNYNLIMGAPGRSYALRVAKRLGIADDVLERARGMIDPRREQAEEYIERVREEALRERETLAKLQREATRQLADAQQMLEQARADMALAERESTEMVEQAREQLLQEAQRVRRELRKAVRTTESGKTWREARRAVDAVARPIRSDTWLTQTKNAQADGAAADGMSHADRGEVNETTDNGGSNGSTSDKPRYVFRVGDTVRLTSMGVTGTIQSFGGGGKATVKAGPMSFDTSIGLLELVEESEQAGADESEGDQVDELGVDPVYMPSADLDVRGSRAHHIESMLRQFIDHAFVQGLSTVRIIHGRGTGALREVVREVLGRESQVSGWHTAPEDKGGDAATIATLG